MADVPPRDFNSLVKSLLERLPSGGSESFSHMESQFKALLKQMLQKMDLVTREEFDACQQLVRQLEKQVSELEQRISQSQPSEKGSPKQ